MADESEDVLDLEDELEDQGETPEDDDQQGADEGDDADETLIGFEDEDPIQAEPENSVVRRLRDQLETEKKLRKEAQAKIPKVEVGNKPDLWEDCEGDPDKFEAALNAYNARKAAAEAEAARATTTNEGARQEYNTELAEYAQQRTKIARPDFDVAETVVTTKLNEVQQSVLVMASKNKAALIYALGKSPERLDALASIENPIKLAVAINEMERSLKVQARRKAPDPEPRMRGGTPAGGIGKTAEQLEKQADKTGDSSALIKHRYEQKQAAKKR